MVLAKLVGFVCEKQPQASEFNESSSDVTTIALTILMDINKKYPVEMQRNSLQMLVGIFYLQ